EGVSVVAISGDDVIVVAHEGAGPDRDRFLTDVEVEKSANFAPVVLPQRFDFEAANSEHVAQHVDLVVLAEFLIDRGLAVVLDRFRFNGGCHKWELGGKIFAQDLAVQQGSRNQQPFACRDSASTSRWASN